MNLRKSDSKILRVFLQKNYLYREKIISYSGLSSTSVDISLKRLVPKFITKKLERGRYFYSLNEDGKKIAKLLNGDEDDTNDY